MRTEVPKRRARRNRDLPDNLYSTRRADGREYFMYRTPAGQKRGMGYDRAEAITAARELNAYFGQRSTLVERIVSRPEQVTLADYVEDYIEITLPRRRVKGKPLSPAYLAETRRILARIVEAFGNRPVAEIRQRELAAYLAGIDSADAHNQHRVRLIQIWRQAISDELVTENLPERILPRDLSDRQRQRLTLEQYRAIFAQARPAIQIAMDLSLNSLQRRSDVRKWRFTDQRDGYAHVIQSKTRKHGPSAWLRIPLDLPVAHSELGRRTLGGLIEACKDSTLCPFLVHEKPDRIRTAAGKDHPFQLTLRAISQGFADARDACGLFDRMPAPERPTFHELISLGQHLRERQGWSLEQIQRLRGHSTAKMTERYQEGHTWTTVEIA